MAFGPNHFNLTISLDKLFCFQGDDINNVFGPESEPYLWVFMIKIDGDGLRQSGNHLVGSPVYKFPTSSQGNIGGSIKYGTRALPAAVGRWTTSLRPITISVPGHASLSIPGRIICGGVLLEENLTPNSAVEAARESTIALIKQTATSTLASLGLSGLAADAQAHVMTSGGTFASALQHVLDLRLKPIRDLFEVAAPAQAVVTILKHLDVGGFLGTAIDRDKPMGTFSRSFGQAELIMSTKDSPLEINHKMWNMPEWAYTVHGRAWAHRKWVRNSLPAATRLQVTCTTKGPQLSQARRIVGIGGIDGNISWAMGRAEAAQEILDGRRTFFVRSATGREAEVRAVQGGYYAGRPWYFLQTTPDHDAGNNLVNLPDCPPGGSYHEVWY